MSLNKLILILICCIILSFVITTSVFCLDVYLKEYTEYNKDFLYLDDIISVKNADHTVKSTLLSLPLQLTSYRIHILSANTIRKMIEKHYSGPLIIIGNKAVCIPDKAIPKYSTWFFNKLLSFLCEYDNNSQGRLEIEILTVPAIDFQTQVSEVQFSLEDHRSSNGFLVGQINIRASSDHAINKFSEVISLSFHRFLTVAVPIRPLKHGDRLSRSDLLFIEKDIASIQENILLESMICDHYITINDLNAAEIITLSKLKTDFIVKKGDHINIIFIAKGIQVFTKGRSMQSGYLGAEILVQPRHITKKFIGTILNGKEVVVELE